MRQVVASSHVLPLDKVHWKRMQAGASSVQQRRVGWGHCDLLLSPSKFSFVVFYQPKFPFFQSFHHMLPLANPSSILCSQGFTLSSGSRVRNCTHQGWRGAVPLCQGSHLVLSFGKAGNYLFFRQKRMNPTFGLNLRSCRRGNSSFARTSDSLVALNHCQSPTVFRTE